MYILVRYNKERAKHIVQDKDIRRFRPIDIEDFERNELYDVWWDGDENTRGDYYPANILHMTHSFFHFLKVKGCPPQELQERHKCLQRYLAQKCADLRR
ncbi:hypothetical protein HPB50_021741 [Hyalomma asiaticum]|uniref:Uncharacterized protein n=1 Tax=Hyalomma asiaticum TaxID=266040 RepID=A0ACB7S5I1_HYAAI|nr:hypothetical protein HPB50_021741 [Hyalomma asiaticum]